MQRKMIFILSALLLVTLITIVFKNNRIEELTLDKEAYKKEMRELKQERIRLINQEKQIEGNIKILRTRIDSLFAARNQTPSDEDIKDTYNLVDINDSWQRILQPMAAEIDSASR